MPRICIQPGHINIGQNSILQLHSSTGAPGEQELTLRIANRLSAILRERGLEVYQTDANANDDPKVRDTDWALFIALHGDADYAGDMGSGFATFPEPSTDGATQESQRIAKIVNEVYFPETQIAYRDLANDNTKYYYMWKYLSSATPCVLIEMGQVQDPHDRILLANTDLIANALGRAICKAFNMPFDKPAETPSNPPTTTPNPAVSPEVISFVNQTFDIINSTDYSTRKYAKISKLAKPLIAKRSSLGI